MKNDDFGNRMKGYEFIETERKFDLTKPIYARVDGRSFSNFTRGFNKPFDRDLSNAMVETTKYLVHKTSAKIGYTQSDEISLIWLANQDQPESGMFFDGKAQKMCSILAAMTTAKFITQLPIDQNKLPHFDARVINLPDKEEAANMLLWRAMDAKKNAVLNVGQAYFSHNQMQNKGQNDVLEMLDHQGIHFGMYPTAFRHGSFIQKRNVTRYLTDEELKKIPADHRPTTPVIRSDYRVLDMPPFNKVNNRIEVIFDSEEPIV